jgi:hypothetical protein
MPLITVRSSARFFPRTSVGKTGSIRLHCSSESQNRFPRMQALQTSEAIESMDR